MLLNGWHHPASRQPIVNQPSLTALIKERFDSLPRQARQVAAFVLDNPHEVAVLSMREQARLAEVPPSTMTRFAKALGLDGYDAIRDVFKSSLRARGNEFGSRAQGLVELNQRIGEAGLAMDLAHNATAQIQSLCAGETMSSIVRAARLLSSAREIFCLGLRGSFPVAFQFAHVCEYFARNVTLVDGAGESGIMKVMHQPSSRDVALICSMAPHSRRAMSIATHLEKAGVKLVVITDSASSPLARIATESILVPNKGPSFFDTLLPAFLVAEILVALMAATSRINIKSQIADTEKKLWGVGEWWGMQADAAPAPRAKAPAKRGA
ncbi:RpiR family transcriptional regulator [Herbaspirillum sp. SJZ130]|nr:MurR/RpiR family transcriptional regulator [Herbaspirillum sp. SJZ102]TQK13316.1 RpiR family transcriptional regulator [Herbaspirillum sp. SJZ130]TQK15320.1 RpiR family transcriptional regulator [Herbaspirillum sp. SJZ106]